MPCTKCRSDFNFFNWKLKCGECSNKYCTKCLTRKEGVLYCEKCTILLRRPPDPVKLMELKPKDLQDYLNKHNISTYGLVEKQELVDLFCNKHIPVKPRKGVEKLTANFAGSVPNLRPQTFFNDLLSDIESVFPDRNNDGNRTTNTFPTYSQTCGAPPRRPAPPPPTSPPPPPSQPHRPSAPPMPSNSMDSQATTSSSSSNNLNAQKTPESSPIPRKYPQLSDYDKIEELNNLSAKDLKLLLTIYRVDYKGCVEKSELLERVERLWNDNIKQAEDLSDNLDDLCKLCMDAPLGCVLLECGHIATCIDCGKRLAECPICRQYVVRVVKTFKA